MARKRKATVRREPNGQAQREPARVIRELAELNRIKHQGVPEKDAGDPLAGFTLGILRLRGRASREDPQGISEPQYQAGEKWGEICRRHRSLQGYEVRPMASPSFMHIERGSSVYDPDLSTVARVRNDFVMCYDALAEAAAMHGIAVTTTTYAVCVECVPVAELSERDFGNLRLGLNALAKALGVGR